MDPTWLIKVVDHKRCNNWLHMFCFTPLGMTYGFRWVNLKVGRLSYHTSKGFYLLTYLLKTKTQLVIYQENKITKHLAILILSSVLKHKFDASISGAESASFSPFSAIPLSCHCGRHPIFLVLMNVNLAPSFYPEITRCCIICERYVGLRYLYYKPQLDLMASYRSLIKSLNQCCSRSTSN
jgi:hypothetical protein